MTKRLLAYTDARLFRFGAIFLRSRRHDFVHDSVKLILDGTRKFDPAQQTLFRALTGIIDSLISHELEKSTRRGVHLSLVPALDDNAVGPQLSEEHLPSAENFESEIILRDQWESFSSSLDEELKAYVRLRMSGCYNTAEEYAAALNTTVEEIRNMDRRLRRRRVQWSSSRCFERREP